MGFWYAPRGRGWAWQCLEPPDWARWLTDVAAYDPEALPDTDGPQRFRTAVTELIDFERSTSDMTAEDADRVAQAQHHVLDAVVDTMRLLPPYSSRPTG